MRDQLLEKISSLELQLVEEPNIQHAAAIEKARAVGNGTASTA